jgi:hypothetical protein
MWWEFIVLGLCLLVFIGAYTYAFVAPVLDKSPIAEILDKKIDAIANRFQNQHSHHPDNEPRDRRMALHNVRGDGKKSYDCSNQDKDQYKPEVPLAHAPHSTKEK